MEDGRRSGEAAQPSAAVIPRKSDKPSKLPVVRSDEKSNKRPKTMGGIWTSETNQDGLGRFGGPRMRIGNLELNQDTLGRFGGQRPKGMLQGLGPRTIGGIGEGGTTQDASRSGGQYIKQLQKQGPRTIGGIGKGETTQLAYQESLGGQPIKKRQVPRTMGGMDKAETTRNVLYGLMERPSAAGGQNIMQRQGPRTMGGTGKVETTRDAWYGSVERPTAFGQGPKTTRDGWYGSMERLTIGGQDITQELGGAGSSPSHSLKLNNENVKIKNPFSDSTVYGSGTFTEKTSKLGTYGARSKFLGMKPIVMQGAEQDIGQMASVGQVGKGKGKSRKAKKKPISSSISEQESYAAVKARVKALKEETRLLTIQMQEEAEKSGQINEENEKLLAELRTKLPPTLIAELEAENPSRKPRPQ